VENLEPIAVSTPSLSGGSGDQFGGGNGEPISGDWSWRRRVSQKGSGWYGGTVCKGRGSKSKQVVVSCEGGVLCVRVVVLSCVSAREYLKLEA
jgi:hypothetical protein